MRPRPRRPVRRARVRVLLAIDEPAAWGREVMLGVARLATEHDEWELLRGAGHGGSLWDALGSLRPYDAVITTRPRDPRAMELHARGLPMVAAAIAGPPTLPTVLADDVAVGRLAAEYFASLGYRRFALVRDAQPYSELRQEGFQAWLAGHRLPEPSVHTYTMLNAEAAGRLQQWLRGLAKPLAVFAGNDDMAVSVIQACRSIGASVPDDVSVLGVNNGAFDCEMATPPLSSIDHNLRGVGYRAAELLAEILRGGSPPVGPHVIAPIGVVRRASTAMRAIPDTTVTQALAYIRDNATSGITVDDVLEHLMVSRATLDRGFKRWLGRTAHSEIQRRRIARARDLLAHTDLDMMEVGTRSGFNYRQQFHAAFRADTGLTPREYRIQARRT